MCDKLEEFKRKDLNSATARRCSAAVAAAASAQGKEREPAGRSLSMLLAWVWRYAKRLVSVSVPSGHTQTHGDTGLYASACQRALKSLGMM